MAYGAVLGQRVDSYRKDETYSKQQANDRFALALKTDTGKGTSFDIYPDEGSNISMTAYGYTQQDGSGNPSPENVRPIKVGGIPLVEVTIDDSLEWMPFNQNTMAYTILPIKAKGNYYNVYTNSSDIHFDPSTKPGDGKSGFNITGSANYFVLNLQGFGITALEDIKAWLSKHPFKIWYGPGNTGDATGIFSPAYFNKPNLQGEFLPLTEPLCDGDYVVSMQDGQCAEYHAKCIVEFDGTEDWSHQDSQYFSIMPVQKPTLNDGGVKCSVAVGGYYYLGNSVFTASNRIIFGKGFADLFNQDLQAWKTYLAEQKSNGTPVQVVYNLATPITYTHSPVPLIAAPDTTGKVTVSGEKEISAIYNKSIARAIQELQSTITTLSSRGGQ